MTNLFSPRLFAKKGFDRLHVVGRQLQVGCPHQFAHLSRPSSPDNGGRDRRVTQYPRDRDLTRWPTMRGGDRLEEFDQLQVPRQERLLEVRVPPPPIVRRQGGNS